MTHAQIEDGVFAPLRGTMLQAVAGGIAYRAIRNRGTVGAAWPMRTRPLTGSWR